MNSRLQRQLPRILSRLQVSQDAPVLVAVSGGLDSTVLLHLLRFGKLQLDLHVAHFDHRLRPLSAEDAEWVRGVAMALGLPFHCAASLHPLRSEDAARTARYAFLSTVAAQIGARAVITAHHADDQVETLLFRLMRGTGLDGLAGIPARRGQLVRPLLGFNRAELERYATQNRIGYRVDLTNASRTYARNRIRHDLLPGLEAGWPGIRSDLLALAGRAAGHRRDWNSRLGEIEKVVVTHKDTTSIELARSALLAYHPEVRARLLRRLIARLHAPPGRAGTVAAGTFIISGVSGTGIQLAGVRVERAFDTILLTTSPAIYSGPADETLTIVSRGSGNGVIIIGGKRFQVRWSGALDGDAGRAAGAETRLRIAESRFPLRIRAWQPGDRIELNYGSKKLKKLFLERRLARAHRHTVPVVVDAEDKVLWVVGLALAAHAVGMSDEPVLSIAVSDGQSD